MDKLSDEQTRLIKFLRISKHHEAGQTTISCLFNKTTVQSLTNKGLISDNYSRGVYYLTLAGKALNKAEQGIIKP